MKQILKFLQTLFDVPHGTQLEEYITWKRPQNHADLERIIQEYQRSRATW
jgi:hypothetical protein